MRYLFWRGSRGVRVGRRDGASRGVPGAVGGVDFGRVRGSAVWSGHGGCGRGIHGTFIFILSSSDDRSFVRRSRARAQEETDPLLFCFSFFFFCKKPAKRQKKAREREKKSKISCPKKKILEISACLFAFFQKKVERNLLIEK